MDLQFLKSKSGDYYFTLDSINFHSSYSPVKECERFLNLNTFDFIPSAIIIFEPGLPYLYDILKQKFPETKIGIVRIIPDFPNSNRWDFVIYNITNFTNEIYKFLTPEELLLSQFLVWPVSEKLFPNESQIFFSQIKVILNDSKIQIITRQYFEKKWLINACNYIKYLKSYIKISKTDLPIVIAASGPSIKSVLPLLQKFRNRFILIALSSAVTPLLNNQLFPDLILSTDGGFWAGQHLKKIPNLYFNLGLPIEAFLPKSLFESTNILPLNYPDGITSSFFKLVNIPFLQAQRNGTVSGTALEFALDFTSNKIFFCGLDLLSNKEFQHIQPNELEINAAIFDTKISNLEKRNFRSSLSNDSLKIYRNWFENFTNTNRVFRIISSNKQNALGNIKDLSETDFNDILQNYDEIHSKKILTQQIIISPEEKNEHLKLLLEFITKNIFDFNWQKQLFPLDFVSKQHFSNEEDILSVKNRINKNTSDLLNKIKGILNE